MDVVLSPEGPQSESLSGDVSAALDTEPKAKAFFESLATFIESVKRPETRAARIKEIIELLKTGKKQK